MRPEHLHQGQPVPRAFRLIGLALILGLSACQSLPVPDKPAAPAAPANFSAAHGTTGNAADPVGPWWQVFADPGLNARIDQAMRSNQGIQIAAARLNQARALARQSQAQGKPQVGVAGTGNRQGGPLINAAGGSGALWSLSGSAAYEVDLFGRIAQDVQAAQLDAQAREALLRAAQLLIQAEVAQQHFALSALDSEAQLLEAVTTSQQRQLQLLRQRFESGSIAEIEVRRAEAELAQAQAEAQALARRRDETGHALAVLLGQAPGQIDVQTQAWAAELPMIPAGIPSTVLQRRPDLQAAQASLSAAHTRAGLAARAYLPSLSLTASSGFASPDLGKLLALGARAWGMGALLSLPLIDGGRREAGAQAAAAELDAAAAQYREQALVAFREVEDQLSALRWLAEQSESQARAVVASRRASQLAESRYRSGSASQFEWLDAQRTELRSRRAALQLRAARYQATVGLIKALGGGWQAGSASLGKAPIAAGAADAGE